MRTTIKIQHNRKTFLAAPKCNGYFEDEKTKMNTATLCVARKRAKTQRHGCLTNASKVKLSTVNYSDVRFILFSISFSFYFCNVAPTVPIPTYQKFKMFNFYKRTTTIVT